MRRSSAPSCQSSQTAKRGKFVAPFKANAAQSNNAISTPLSVSAFSERTTKGLQTEKFIEKKDITNSENGKICSDEKRRGSLYFSVVWCKASRKKHKKWDGDGILLVHSKSVALKDLDGKDIGRSSGFKETELENLVAGSLLFVGNKEVEIIDQVSQEMYLSGRCFVQSTTEVDVINAEKAVDDHKALVNPLPDQENKAPVRKSFNGDTRQQENVAPRHNPCAVGAIMMPRPSASYLWFHNKSGRAIVDVVLDPYLCNHLRPHQVKGVTFLYKCVMGMGDFNGNGAILADEMGVGKTLQCIALIWTLLKQGPFSGRPVIKRCIVVVPGSLVKNWCAEFKKWLGNERIKTFPIGPNKRIDEFAKSVIYPVMVVSYEMLLRYISDVQSINFDLIICDEAHRLKNCGIKTTAAIAGLGIKRMVLLTGTPIQNDLGELYALAQLCNPGIFGSVSSFRQVFENPIGKCQEPNCSKEEEEIGNKRAAELKRLTELFILRRTSVVNEKFLPAKVELAVFCSTSALQRKLYERIIESKSVRSCLSASAQGSRHFICISALKKLCNHPLLLYNSATEFEENKSLCDDDFEGNSLYARLVDKFPDKYSQSYEVSHSGKLQVLDSLLDAFREREEKAVIVSNSTKALDIFEKLLKMKEREFLRLDGQTSTEDRQNLVDRFNSKQSNIDIFLLSSKAGGTGLNLIGASRLILYDIDWNPANDIQAMARIWRDGQRKAVFIYRLLSTGTIEEKIFQRQISKQCLSGSVVDLQKNNVSFSREELKDLFTLEESTTCKTHELLDCNCIYMPQDFTPGCNIKCETRPTQLGVQFCNPEKVKRLSVAQLMSWSHIKPGESEKLKDDVLRKCLENVTFIFQNESGAD